MFSNVYLYVFAFERIGVKQTAFDVAANRVELFGGRVRDDIRSDDGHDERRTCRAPRGKRVQGL